MSLNPVIRTSGSGGTPGFSPYISGINLDGHERVSLDYPVHVALADPRTNQRALVAHKQVARAVAAIMQLRDECELDKSTSYTFTPGVGDADQVYWIITPNESEE